MANVQERREQFNKGDTVHLLINVGKGKSPKRRPAEVLEVMRAACRIRIEGETQPRTVRFNALEPAPAPPPPTPPTPPTPIRSLSGFSAPQTQTPQREEPPDDIATWLDMGRQILEPLSERIAQLTEEDAALEDEAKAIAQDRKRVQDELKRTKRRITKLSMALDDDDDEGAA